MLGFGKMRDPARIKVLLAFVSLAVSSAASRASADCSSGAAYAATVKGNTVQIVLEETSRKCGGPIPMLRQDTQTGEVVKLADDCDNGAYVDECVPPGVYRYGFAKAYDCSEQGCSGVEYYVGVTMSSAVDGCMRGAGHSAPTAYSDPVPWGSNTSPLLSCPSGCGCSTPGRGILGFDGALAGLSVIALWRRRRATRR
jgi:hypothetical protein